MRVSFLTHTRRHTHTHHWEERKWKYARDKSRERERITYNRTKGNASSFDSQQQYSMYIVSGTERGRRRGWEASSSAWFVIQLRAAVGCFWVFSFLVCSMYFAPSQTMLISTHPPPHTWQSYRTYTTNGETHKRAYTQVHTKTVRCELRCKRTKRRRLVSRKAEPSKHR